MAFVTRLSVHRRSLLKKIGLIHRGLSCRALTTPATYSHRTDENVIKSNFDCQYSDEDAFSFFSKKFLEYGDELAIVDESRETSATYKEIVNNGRRLASFFHQQGYQTSQRIAINTPNCLQYSYSAMATLANGMVLNTANSAYTSHELKTMLQSSEPRALITSARQLDESRKGVDETSVDLVICIDDVEINDSGVINMSDILACGDENFTKDLSSLDPRKETGFLLYSSGTTGLPKGVKLSHKALTSNVIQATRFMEGMIPSNILCVLPMYHLYGLIYIMMIHLYNKSIIHVLDGFTPEKFLSVIQEKKIERLSIVPPMALFLMNHQMVNDYNLSSLRSVTVAAAPMDEVATTKFYETFPLTMMQQGYGLTESGITHGQPPHRHLQKAGSCGFVYPGTECKVVCVETGEALGTFEQGEICLRGPQIMTGYLNNDKATSDTIDKDDWVHSGDLGYYDEDFNFYIIDRLKELIKYKALQVAPAELEDVLLGNDFIVEACVIGVPCDRAGELPRAYVIKKEDSPLTEDDVKAYIAERLSDHKRLRGGVVFVNEIPKSAAGKLLRRHLKDEYLKSLDNILKPSQ